MFNSFSICLSTVNGARQQTHTSMLQPLEDTSIISATSLVRDMRLLRWCRSIERDPKKLESSVVITESLDMSCERFLCRWQFCYRPLSISHSLSLSSCLFLCLPVSVSFPRGTKNVVPWLSL